MKILAIEQYFRPSRLPMINVRDLRVYFYGERPEDIVLPNDLYLTPEDTILNYYSALREAARPLPGNMTGCGTIGYAQQPYPVAYHFLSSYLQSQMSFEEFLTSFDNVLRLNLIKMEQVPPIKEQPQNSIRYFVEYETIEGAKESIGYFAYYYGFLFMIQENNEYRILQMDLSGENYLCAPYHGWDYKAEYIVDIKYGTWCKMVDLRFPTQYNGFKVSVYFKGTDGYDYRIDFFELTNGTDIEIAQFRKENDIWHQVFINPYECLV